jgi:lysozyme family protein
MADFQKALAYTLAHEGGWSDDPADPGGATNFGITLKTAQRFGVKTKEELRRITPERVAEIYEAGYWKYGGVEDQRVATKLFDMAVNMGPATAGKLLLRALCLPSGASGADRTPDASATFGDVNAAGAAALLVRLCLESEAHYRAIVKRRPASAKFLKGWLKRANEVPNG